MGKCIFKPNECLYVDLSKLESCSNTECSIRQMHLGPDESCVFLMESKRRTFLKRERWSYGVNLRAVLTLGSSVLMISA